MGFSIRAQWLRRPEPMQIAAEKACDHVYVILSPGWRSLASRDTVTPWALLCWAVLES